MSGAHLDDTERDPAKWEQYSGQLLFATLVQAGSAGFVPYDLPLVQESPTMIVGLTVLDEAFAFVASLNKEMTAFFSESHAFETEEDFRSLYAATLHEALYAFK